MNVDARIIPLESISTVHNLDEGWLCAIFKALGEPQRLRIYKLLFDGERCVCDIEASVRLPQNLVSHHLRVLRDAGLIEFRKERRWSYYRISKAQQATLQPAMSDLFDPSRVSDAPAQC